MRAALIWFVEDLIFPGNATKIEDAQVGQNGEEDENNDEGHREIVNEKGN
jgi:hypothetical protein